MAKDKSSVLNEVLVSLATEAAQDVEGVHLLNSKRNCGAVSVYVLPNEKVAVDLFVSIDSKEDVKIDNDEDIKF